MLKKTPLILLFLILSACGYHLRGDIDLPETIENIYLEAASGSLQQELQNALKSSSGQIVDSVSEAAMVIKITKEEMSTRVTSVSTSGRANQFQLIYQVNFSIYDAKGKVLLANQNVDIKRDYFNDQTDILGKSNEEGVIRAEMYQQAANSIVSRISAAMEAKTKAKAK